MVRACQKWPGFDWSPTSKQFKQFCNIFPQNVAQKHSYWCQPAVRLWRHEWGSVHKQFSPELRRAVACLKSAAYWWYSADEWLRCLLPTRRTHTHTLTLALLACTKIIHTTWYITFTCTQKLTARQLNLPHGTEYKKVVKRTQQQKPELLIKITPYTAETAE